MRVSVDRKNSCFNKRALLADAHVLLNGEKVKFAVEACEEGGWVDHYEVDKDGRMVIEPGHKTSTIIRSTGKVEIRLGTLT